MKTKFKILTLLIVISILSVGKTVVAEEKTKELYEAWAAKSVQTLDITNKYGEVKVTNNRADSVTIAVTIIVEASNENKANDLLDKIEVTFRKSGSTISAITNIENNFKSQREFSINYEINIPSDKNLKIANKYGNTFVHSLTANGDFNIQYGNLNANELVAPENGSMKVYLAYGKSSIESASDLDVQIKYSNMTLGEIGNLKLESKYSTIDIEEGKLIQIDSKYDKFNFEEVKSVSATTKYSHLRIEELSTSLTIESGYGGVRVGQIAPDFESISITNSYGQISLGLDDASYTIDASCEYCGISYPEDNFKGNKMKERNTRTIKGKVGNAGGGNVMIKSRYGEIKLR